VERIKFDFNFLDPSKFEKIILSGILEKIGEVVGKSSDSTLKVFVLFVILNSIIFVFVC
jgi:hypothetical protein